MDFEIVVVIMFDRLWDLRSVGVVSCCWCLVRCSVDYLIFCCCLIGLIGFNASDVFSL